MSNLFEANTTFNEDISSWDVSNVTDIGYMFNGATAFNQSLDDWNTSNVSNMKAVFKEATSFNEDISNWNVSKVTDMALMFQRPQHLIKIFRDGMYQKINGLINFLSSIIIQSTA